MMRKSIILLMVLALVFMIGASDLFAHQVTLRLQDSDANGLKDGKARYGSGTSYYTAWWPGGLTQSDGNTNSVDMATGTYSFEMFYNGTSNRKISVYIDSDVTLTWTTTTVTLQFSGKIRYGGSSGTAAWFKSSTSTSTATKELMAGRTYKFRVDPHGVFDLTIGSPPSMTKTLVHLKLKDHNGNPLSGGKGRGGQGSAYYTWWAAVNPTNSQGVAVDVRNGLKTNLSYQMLYNNGGQVKGPQDVSVNSFFEFQTAQCCLKLEKCDGTPLKGGKARFGAKSKYYTSWWPGGTTGSDGQTCAELFPGTYSFEMQYQGTSDRKMNKTIPDDCPLVWKTTEVTLHYDGKISYGGGSGDSRWFNEPMMDLLAGTYKFHFRGGGRTDLTFSGCSFEKSFIVLTVLDEKNNGVPGGKATPAVGGSWKAQIPGQTDNNGKLFGEIVNGFTKIKMTVNQGAEEQTVAQLEASNYTWYTEILRIWLDNHAGNPITDKKATLSQGGGYWYSWGNLNASGYLDIQLFPRSSSYKFKMNYNFTSETKYPVVAVNSGVQDFVFQTGEVVGPTCTHFSAGAWRTFTDPMQLMPGTRDFKFNDGTPTTSFTVVVGKTLTIPTGTLSKGIADQFTDSVELPKEFGLSQNYPNPFNPTTTIGYQLPETGHVRLTIYNILGAKILTLVDESKNAGYYDAIWHGTNEQGQLVANGVYFYRIDAADFTDVKPMMMLK